MASLLGPVPRSHWTAAKWGSDTMDREGRRRCGGDGGAPVSWVRRKMAPSLAVLVAASPRHQQGSIEDIYLMHGWNMIKYMKYMNY